MSCSFTSLKISLSNHLIIHMHIHILFCHQPIRLQLTNFSDLSCCQLSFQCQSPSSSSLNKCSSTPHQHPLCSSFSLLPPPLWGSSGGIALLFKHDDIIEKTLPQIRLKCFPRYVFLAFHNTGWAAVHYLLWINDLPCKRTLVNTQVWNTVTEIQ